MQSLGLGLQPIVKSQVKRLEQQKGWMYLVAGPTDWIQNTNVEGNVRVLPV